jgi:putative FmdB family regulatory protein
MPVYEYLCLDCRRKVSISHPMRPQHAPCCPACCSTRLQRLITGVTVVQSARQRSRDVSWIDDAIRERVKKAQH